MSLVGEAHVKWDETRSEGTGQNSTTTTETYSNHEKYIDQKVILYGSGKTVFLLQFLR